MAKSKPIGVRFDTDLLNSLEKNKLANSPQKALNFLSDFYVSNQNNQHQKIIVRDLNKPTNLVEPKKPMGTEKSNITINTLPKDPAVGGKLNEYKKELDLLKDQNTFLANKRKKWLQVQINTLG